MILKKNAIAQSTKTIVIDNVPAYLPMSKAKKRTSQKQHRCQLFFVATYGRVNANVHPASEGWSSRAKLVDGSQVIQNTTLFSLHSCKKTKEGKKERKKSGNQKNKEEEKNKIEILRSR